ncbi:MAG: hypothetical protein QM621_14405 [Aeromicrobium sp.]|uniref:LVIVD repeat-containing protein n=1 Tax=Aeromicrobium sp. TaxID=1871063 RepID=UPI0039E3F591
MKRVTSTLAAAGLLAALSWAATTPTAGADEEAEGEVPRALCSPDSYPETGLQGQVSREDRDSGRSQEGYSCNLSLVGQYQGDGATWTQPSYEHCSYLGTFAPGPLLQEQRGVHVLDVSDETNPTFSTSLDSTAALMGTWESLKVDPVHGRLAMTGASVPPGVGVLAFDLYDIADDCTQPELLNGLAGSLTIPMPVFGHEGAWSPDGQTYWAMAAGAGGVQAIDVSDPANPRLIYTGTVGLTNHGVSFSPDGRTMYGVTMVPAGVQILDVSDIQDREPLPQIRQIGSTSWTDGLLSQHTLNFTSDGHPYLFAVDEAGGGGVRLVDVADPGAPEVVRQYRLEINRPENAAQASADTGGNGIFGYDAHYCSLDRQVDPTMLACGYFQSGLRLFDITDPLNPRELAYYQPPAQVGREAGTADALVNSAHAWAVYAPNALDPQYLGMHTVTGSLNPSMTTDWCTSQPEFRPDDTIWMTCQDNGFMVLAYEPYRLDVPEEPIEQPDRSAEPVDLGAGGGEVAAGDTLPDTGARRWAAVLAVVGAALLGAGVLSARSRWT